jgi:hypothetical protein
MVNNYAICGYQIVNAMGRLAAMRQFFSGKNGNIFDLGLKRARCARVRAISGRPESHPFQKKRHRR